jgi:hypothetical protein
MIMDNPFVAPQTSRLARRRRSRFHRNAHWVSAIIFFALGSLLLAFLLSG